jgi:hypothetical protein
LGVRILVIVFLKVTQQHLINLLQRIRQHEDRNESPLVS